MAQGSCSIIQRSTQFVTPLSRTITMLVGTTRRNKRRKCSAQRLRMLIDAPAHVAGLALS